ncbi:MAG: hypothetical protein RR662_04620 [Clostridia bacterium]
MKVSSLEPENLGKLLKAIKILKAFTQVDAFNNKKTNKLDTSNLKRIKTISHMFQKK